MEPYDKLVKQFEPMPSFKLYKQEAEGLRTSALASIAISLKRIADSLEKDQIEGPPDCALNIKLCNDDSQDSNK